MIGHQEGCTRRAWLEGKRRRGVPLVELLAAVLFREGPACDCPAAEEATP
jgi:hypothetical protein